MPHAVLVDALRTPIGRFQGGLASVRPDDLAAVVIREVVHRSGVDPEALEEVFFGCANQAGEDNRNVARMAALLAGLPHHVPAVTVNRLCASMRSRSASSPISRCSTVTSPPSTSTPSLRPKCLPRWSAAASNSTTLASDGL